MARRKTVPPLRRLALFLLLLPKVLDASAPPCTPANPSCFLSGDINTWNTMYAEQYPNLTRYWSHADLKDSYPNMGSLQNAERLLGKLNSGQPVRVAGIGSSVLASFGGCFQTSYEALLKMGTAINPSVYPQPGQLHAIKLFDDRLSGCWKELGFMTLFMDTLNKTWPNAEHMWFNLGRNGASMETFTSGICWEDGLPEEVDIILVEHQTIFARQFCTEHVVRTLMSSHPHAVLLLFSNTCLVPFLSDTPEDRNFSKAFNVCFQSSQPERFCPAVEQLHPGGITPDEDAFLRNRDQVPQRYAELYDIAHLAVHPGMMRLIALKNIPNVSAWMIMRDIYADRGHPKMARAHGRGALFFADLMVGWLYQLQQGVLQAAAARSGSGGGEIAQTSATLPKAHWPVAEVVHKSRCYGISYEMVLNASKASVEHHTYLHKLDEEAALKDRGEQSWLESSGFNSVPELNVLSLSGFTVQGLYMGKLGQRFKPGFLTNTSGSELKFEVDATFPEFPSSQVELRLSYTASYDGWGKAELSCVSGCTCSRVTIDAHTTDESSVIKNVGLNLSRSNEHCTLSVLTLPESSSVGHKFKVSQVMVRVQLPGSA